jgi:hypothetical protein
MPQGDANVRIELLEPDNHLAVRLAGLHQAMRFSDLLDNGFGSALLYTVSRSTFMP